MQEDSQSESDCFKVLILISLSFGYHVILIKVNTPPRGKATGKQSLFSMKVTLLGEKQYLDKEWQTRKKSQ